jgi:hypothetical protein
LWLKIQRANAAITVQFLKLWNLTRMSCCHLHEKMFCLRDKDCHNVTRRSDNASTVWHLDDETSIYADNLRKLEATNQCDPERESYTLFYEEADEILHTDVKRILTIRFSDSLLNLIQNTVM